MSKKPWLLSQGLEKYLVRLTVEKPSFLRTICKIIESISIDQSENDYFQKNEIKQVFEIDQIQKIYESFEICTLFLFEMKTENEMKNTRKWQSLLVFSLIIFTILSILLSLNSFPIPIETPNISCILPNN